MRPGVHTHNTPRDAQRAAGGLCAQTLAHAATHIRPGTTTAQLGAIIADHLLRHNASSVMLGASFDARRPFPACVAINVNEEVTHSIPGPRILRGGDIVTIDLAVRAPGEHGLCADAAITRVVGPAADHSRARTLLAAARSALAAALSILRPGVLWDDVVFAASAAARRHQACLIPQLASHGIGHDLHEVPVLPWQPGSGITLARGMTLAIEPAVVEGLSPPALIELDDGWTTITPDRRWAAFEERTVRLTRHHAQILTPALTSSPA